MGRMKEWMAREMAQGFDSRDTRVCRNCVEDEALRSFIRREGESGYKCSYCKHKASKTTISFNDFTRHVLTAIETEWGDANNEGVPYDEGEYAGQTYDSYDLLHDELDIGFKEDSLRDDLVSSLGDHVWCQRNFFELEPNQALSAGWREFTNVVKHESRYVFLRRPDTRKWRGSEEIPPADFLDAFSSVVSDCGLYTTLKSGTEICRLRVHGQKDIFTKAVELGAPPANLARTANRMSAAGITAFYGAFDRETAIAETAISVSAGSVATLGRFKLLKDLYLVDFTDVPRMPSIFEPNSRSMRHGLLFLYRFLDDFTSPILKDGREHIEYVPTQVIAEYLRFVHRGNKLRPIDGILYNSARHKGAQACVLFFGPDGSCDPGDENDAAALVLQSVEPIELTVKKKAKKKSAGN